MQKHVYSFQKRGFGINIIAITQHFPNYDTGFELTGVVPGHEICGEVLAIGDGVDVAKCDYKLGDKVLVFPWRGK